MAYLTDFRPKPFPVEAESSPVPSAGATPVEHPEGYPVQQGTAGQRKLKGRYLL